jgi:hypothetical protein
MALHQEDRQDPNVGPLVLEIGLHVLVPLLGDCRKGFSIATGVCGENA